MFSVAALLWRFQSACMVLLPTQSGEATERAAIKAVLDARGAAWTRGDAAAATAILTDDADWVSGGGTVLVGRPAIAKMHRDMLGGL